MSFPVPNDAIVNAGFLYITGLQLTRTGNATLTMGAGQARNNSNVNDIALPELVTLNTATSGANGLDTGTIAVSTKYAVLVIASSTVAADTAAMLTLTPDSPYLPADYDMYMRVGYVYTDGSANLVIGRWEGNSADRTFWYDALVSVGTGLTSTTFAAIDVSTAVPYIGTTAILQTTFNANAAGDTFAFRPSGSSSTNGNVILSAAAAAADEVKQCLAEVGFVLTVPSIDYKVTASGSLSVSVAGYYDHLLG